MSGESNLLDVTVPLSQASSGLQAGVLAQPEAGSQEAKAGSQAKTGSQPETGRTWRTVGVIALIVFALMVLDVLLLHPRYETVDDVLQKIVSSGMVYVMKPDDHLLLVDAAHFWLGRAFNSLYAIQLDVPWYDGLQFAMLYAANVLFCSLLWCVHRGRRAVIPTVLYLVAVAAPSLNLLQMTTTTALFGIAGGALIACALSIESWSRTLRVLSMAVGAGVIVFASLLRYEGAQMAMVLTGMYLFVRYTGPQWKKLAVGMAILAVTFVATEALHAVHNDYFERTGWAEFHEFGMQNRKLFDYGRANFSGNEKVLAAFGWSKNDLKMVREQLFFCEKTFSPEKINELSRNCPLLLGVFRPDLPRYLPSQVATTFADPMFKIALFTFAAALLFAGMGKSLPTWRILTMLVLGLSLALAVAGIFKATQHINLPILYCVVIAQLIHLRSDRLDYKQVNGKRFAFALLAVMCLQFLVWKSISLQNTENAELAQRQVQSLKLIEYARQQKDKLFFPFVCLIEMSPFQSTRMFHDFKVVTCYSSRNPMGQAMLKQYGLSDFKSGILSDKVLLISDRKKNKLVSTFFKEHEGKEIRFEPIYVLDRAGQGVYKATLASSSH